MEQITGLPSRWNGSLNISDKVNVNGLLTMSGRKEWNCAITFHRTRLISANWYGTALHEMIHSVSVGLAVDSYNLNKGYEEGVVEQTTRLLLAEVLTSLDIGSTFIDRNRYQKFVDDL